MRVAPQTANHLCGAAKLLVPREAVGAEAGALSAGVAHDALPFHPFCKSRRIVKPERQKCAVVRVAAHHFSHTRLGEIAAQCMKLAQAVFAKALHAYRKHELVATAGLV